MGDLLKTMRSSQLFSATPPAARGDPQDRARGAARAASLLDTAWNDLSFHVSQAFFPRTSAWDNLKKALKTEFDEAVWDHLSGTISAPFTAGDVREVAVKVIDDRGNELLVVKSLDEAE
jgi:adenine-specific DNA-methyltransferase